MNQWINEHPWAFFWLVISAIWAVEEVGRALATAIGSRGEKQEKAK